MWGGPRGPRPTPSSASVSISLAEPDQGVRRGRGRPPHVDLSQCFTGTRRRRSSNQFVMVTKVEPELVAYFSVNCSTRKRLGSGVTSNHAAFIGVGVGPLSLNSACG